MELEFTVIETRLDEFVKAYTLELAQPTHILSVEFGNNWTYRIHLAVQESCTLCVPEDYEVELMSTSSDILQAHDLHRLRVDSMVSFIVLYCFEPNKEQDFGITELCLSEDELQMGANIKEMCTRNIKREDGSALAMELVGLKKEYEVLTHLLANLQDSEFNYDIEAFMRNED